jgi:hypothetical protein
MKTLLCSTAAILVALFAVRADAADLSGRFVYGAAPPAPAKLNIDKDVEAFGNLGLVDETLLVGPDGGIANIVVYCRTEGAPITPEAEKGVAPTVEYDNKGGRFQPRILPLWFDKQKLVVKNSDPVGHNSNYQPLGDQPINPLLTPGGKEEYMHNRKQNLPQPVGCNIHPWMKGYILARDNPYFAVTGADGKFDIKNLPTGVELEFQVWHEKAGYLAAKPEWMKGRFMITLKDGANDLGEIKVDPALFNK